MSSKSRTLLLAFAVVGLGASSVSSYVHYNLLTDPSYSSFCDVSATVTCTEAYTSQYGSFAEAAGESDGTSASSTSGTS